MKKILILLPLSALCIHAIQAQEKKEYTNFSDTTFSIQEVVVQTAKRNIPQLTKLNVPMKYLPISVNRVSGSSLELRGIRNIQEAVRFMPGVRMQTSYGSFQQLSVRGFDHSVMMIDGVRDERSAINNSYPFPDLSAVESIELLKGPASVLYGHSAVGGILNVVRISPKAEQTVNARVSYGSYDNKQATVGMGGHLIGPVNYYANVNFSDQDGWRDNQTKRFSGYLALNAKLTEKDELDVRGAFNRDFYNTEIGLPDLMPADIFNTQTGKKYLSAQEQLPGLNREARYNNESDFMKNHAWNVTAQYTHMFDNGFKLIDKLAYYNDDINYFGTEALDYLESEDPIYDHYYVKDGKKQYICLDTVYLSFPLRFSHISKTISNSLELSGKLNTGEVTHNFVGGYSFSLLNRVSYTGYNLGNDVQGPGLYSHVSVYDPHSMGYMTSKMSKAIPSHNYSNSIYLQDMLDINEHWKALVALRGDFFRYLQANAPTPTGKREYDDADRTAYNRLHNVSFTYRLGAVYLPHPNTSIYASFATFFKPIRTFYSANVMYIDTDGARYYPKNNEEIFKPESGYQAEAGVKYTLSKWLEANASMFYIRKANATQTLATNVEQEINGVATKMSIIGQVGIMDSKGFDLEATFTPVNSLAFTLGYGYTDSRIRKMKKIKDPELAEIIYSEANKGQLEKSTSLEGNYQNNVPKNTFYAYGSYTIPKGILQNLGFNLSTCYTDKVYRNTANSKWFDSYWITDLGASYLLNHHVRLSVNINNIFSKEYTNQALGDQIVPSMPRNYQVAISYNL